LLPAALVRSAVDQCGGELVPRYLRERDYSWLADLISHYEANIGRRRAELDVEVMAALTPRCPKVKLRLALLTLDGLARARTDAALSPRKTRALAFRARAATRPEVERDAIMQRVAREVGVDPQALEEALFADLRGQQRVTALPALSPRALAVEANAALVAALLSRAASLRVRAWENTDAIAREALTLGLICVAESQPHGIALHVSGPLSLFRRTTLYGTALASLMTSLGRCARFELIAHCALPRQGVAGTLFVRTGDPVIAATSLAR
jgi:predicted nuclease of restriction endonuclease-like RecB superfamily